VGIEPEMLALVFGFRFAQRGDSVRYGHNGAIGNFMSKTSA